VYHHSISASMKLRENRIVPPTLGVDPSVGLRLATWAEGTVTIGHTDQESEAGALYANMASDSSSDYTFGGTPSVDSLSFFCDNDGVEYYFTGGIIRGITWNLSASTFSTVDLDVIGQATAKWVGAARTETTHAVSEIVTPAHLSTFTFGSDDLSGCLKGATINWTWATTDIGRQRCGTVVMPRPLRVGRPVITATFNMELDDAASADTVDLLDDLITGATPGNIVLDNFAMSGVTITGDIPDLATGLTDVSITVGATSLVVTTV